MLKNLPPMLQQILEYIAPANKSRFVKVASTAQKRATHIGTCANISSLICKQTSQQTKTS